jgi:hypothetical protein
MLAKREELKVPQYRDPLESAGEGEVEGEGGAQADEAIYSSYWKRLETLVVFTWQFN